MDFKNIFATDIYRYLILVTSNHFPQNKPNSWEEQPLKMIFKMCETSLNNQNGSAHSTNDQVCIKTHGL